VIGLDVVSGPDTTVVASVANRNDVERVFSDHHIETVVHIGALHKPDIARFQAQAFVDVNITGTLYLLEAAIASNHDRFVFTSTTSLMATQAIRDEVAATAVWLDEDFGPLAPRNIQLSAAILLEHGVQEAGQRDQAIRVERVADTRVLDFARDDVGGFQDAQMLRHSGLRQPTSSTMLQPMHDCFSRIW
jgi:nucleoside-diphosphate-sugar epimerase